MNFIPGKNICSGSGKESAISRKMFLYFAKKVFSALKASDAGPIKICGTDSSGACEGEL